LVGWLLGNIAGSIVLSASGDAKVAVADRPVWLSAGMAVALWIPQIGAIVVVSRSNGSGNPLRDLSCRFTRFDLIGLPIGVLSQIALLRGVYWPLQKAWPDTFANRQLERNARDLYDRAHGVSLVVLVGVVVIAAPFVEELVYRGLLQGAARRRFNDVAAVLGVAAFFALIHFRPVEYPGLFVFGLVLGVCAVKTNRLGMGVAAHLAFNATALILVAR
jgi:membrane protease YdiL (CAAX protease family)